jgi:hypothetical protein
MQGVVPTGITPFPFCGENNAVECRNGIGGEMVLARKWQAAAGKPRGTGAQTKAVNPGKSKLNAEADKKIGDNSTTIVDTLYNSFINCKNTTSGKLLIDLADGRINCEDPVVMSQLCSYAESLAGEQQVTGDEVEEAAKTEQTRRADNPAELMTTK